MNAPERIYLQVEGEEWDALPEEVESPDVTWCSDRIHKSDPEYLRSDLFPRWVSVKERLPDAGMFVVCWDGTRLRAFYQSDDNDREYYDTLGIQFWHQIEDPLPKEGE